MSPFLHLCKEIFLDYYIIVFETITKKKNHFKVLLREWQSKQVQQTRPSAHPLLSTLLNVDLCVPLSTSQLLQPYLPLFSNPPIKSRIHQAFLQCTLISRIYLTWNTYLLHIQIPFLLQFLFQISTHLENLPRVSYVHYSVSVTLAFKERWK